MCNQYGCGKILNGKLCKFHGKMPYCDKHWEAAKKAYIVKPLFTTKHYKAIAEVLNGLVQYEVLQDVDTLIVKEFIQLLEKDNPKFKEKEFIKLVYKS